MEPWDTTMLKSMSCRSLHLFRHEWYIAENIKQWSVGVNSILFFSAVFHELVVGNYTFDEKTDKAMCSH